MLGYTAEEARREASRCLDCDQICSLCVGVCPNVALMTYETAPVRAGAAGRWPSRTARWWRMDPRPSSWTSVSRSPS